MDIVLRIHFRKLWSAYPEHQHRVTLNPQWQDEMSVRGNEGLNGSCVEGHALEYLFQGLTLTRRDPPGLRCGFCPSLILFILCSLDCKHGKPRFDLWRVWDLWMGYRQRHPERLPFERCVFQGHGHGQPTVDKRDGPLAR